MKLTKLNCIIIFWGDEKMDRSYRFWHLSKRHVHVSCVVFDGFGAAVHISPGCAEQIKVLRDADADLLYFKDLFKRFSMLEDFGATEMYALEVNVKPKTGFGSKLWYNCQTAVRDFCQLDIGWVANPLHLAYKLNKMYTNYTVLDKWEAA